MFENLAIFTETVLESLFNKVADLKAHNLIKKRLKHRYVPINIEKFLRGAFL